MRKLISILAVAMLLSACGTTNALDYSQVSAPIPRGQARIIVTRAESLIFLAAGAPIEINGQKIETLGRGGSLVKDVSAGPVIVVAKVSSAPGQFVVRFNAEPGKTYRFMVSPKTDTLLLGSAFGIIGDAVHAQISDTSGYFQIEMVP